MHMQIYRAAKKAIACGAVALLMLSGCKMYKPELSFLGGKPAGLRMDQPPPGPPEYQQGWKDGCESGYKGYGEYYAKVWLNFKQDPYLTTNPVYYQAWKDAYGYCASFGNMTTLHGLGNFR